MLARILPRHVSSALRLVAVGITCLLLGPDLARAQWALNGAQVYTTHAEYPHLISDASGGAYIFAEGFPSALLTRLNSSGAVATGWPLEGVTLSNGSGEVNRVVSACLNADGGITAFVGDVGNWCARYSADGQLMPGWPRLQITATTNYAVQVFPLIAGRNLLLIPTETDLVASGTGLRALRLEVDG